jgi:transcriptional regulator with XRE-family HTH domain
MKKKIGSRVRLGLAIRARRESQGYSQESYADKIRMHRTYYNYSAIERGEQNITLDTLETVCKGLGVRMWEVMKEAGD